MTRAQEQDNSPLVAVFVFGGVLLLAGTLNLLGPIATVFEKLAVNEFLQLFFGVLLVSIFLLVLCSSLYYLTIIPKNWKLSTLYVAIFFVAVMGIVHLSGGVQFEYMEEVVRHPPAY